MSKELTREDVEAIVFQWGNEQPPDEIHWEQRLRILTTDAILRSRIAQQNKQIARQGDTIRAFLKKERDAS